ncbi:flavodoxin [Cloacibacillus porcorum]
MNIKKYFFAAACMALLFFALNAAVFCGVANAAAGDKGKRVLVVYYSYSKDGNTRKVARRIHELAGGDIVEIKPVKPYQGAYDEVVRQAQEENAVDYRAPISTKVSDIRSYDVVFVGTPVWWFKMAPPVRSFLASHDLRGKEVVPFCTHGGYGGGEVAAETAKLATGAKVLKGIAVDCKDSGNPVGDVPAWLRVIGVVK